MNAIQRQYARNAAQLRQMADKAQRTGRKVNGYTFEQLTVLADRAERFAQSDDSPAMRLFRTKQST